METKHRHDMKNLLGTILGYAEMLQDEELSTEQNKMVASIERSALKLRELIVGKVTPVYQTETTEQLVQDAPLYIPSHDEIDISSELMEKIISCAQLGRISCLESIIKTVEEPLASFLEAKTSIFAFDEIVHWATQRSN
ncbi:histidine kinase dimerization/phospho-acceptor domain-containing protein [Sulfurimonas microaerophilic]|uniref:histidine kinase dimerization/phospho-acceptor domain-containing protein n=1 Tax=Sulfurimonas microaerophilic TaxID=3058392 RepID=UPI002714957A|nr:histidine kinase dimerization/phospho-acceptor domain-containing protein [Sulfurimonas sp. hsl 1-7]